jgi:hypothetical protein
MSFQVVRENMYIRICTKKEDNDRKVVIICYYMILLFKS